MAVYTISDSLQQTPVFCIICAQAVPAAEVTAGSLHADGRQAFACNAHLRSREKWIIAWVLFDIEQQSGSESRTMEQPA